MPNRNTTQKNQKPITYKGKKPNKSMTTPKSCQLNKERIDDLGKRLDKIEQKLDNIMTKEDFKEWREEFKIDFCQKVDGRLCTLEDKAVKSEIGLGKISAVAGVVCLIVIWALGQLKLIGI
jgi:small-conductance mechanosensitive channel